MDNNELFDNQPKVVNLSRGEVLVRFSKDSEDNVTITYSPDEMLTELDRVIHFLVSPNGEKEYVESKTKEIINHYNLHEYIGAIRLETNGTNLIYFCGRLCDELLIHRFDCTKEDCRNMRDDVENKIKRLKDPRIIEELRYKYPNAKVVKGGVNTANASPVAPVPSYEDTGILVGGPTNKVVEEIKEDVEVSTPPPRNNPPANPGGNNRVIL